MKFRFSGLVGLFFATRLFFLPITLLAKQPVSHVRIVRLSYISGTVTVKRPGATEWAKALVNTPIQEGYEILTSAGSFAEVEFENCSTVRLGELSHLALDQLTMDTDGARLNLLRFEQGYATFHFLPENHDAYTVKIANATLTPSGKSLFRTNLDKGRARVEVFNGSVQIAAPSGSAQLGKDKILEYNTGTTEAALNTRKGIAKDSWDIWTEARDAQAHLAMANQDVGANGPLYGWSDLNTYGEWAMIPGLGYCWLPFVPMNWAPYSLGTWDLYPGMGYTWISGEPWGWLPYHYGKWNFTPDLGWYWIPGNFGTWSPFLVAWYTGHGWVGWSPLGLNPQPWGLNAVTIISGTAIQIGQLITPESISHATISDGTLTDHPPFHPGAGTTVRGAPLSAGNGTSFIAPAGSADTLAPPTILMGGEGDTERALLAGHSLREALRARLGTTMGGRVVLSGRAGEFRGDSFVGMSINGVQIGHCPNGLCPAGSHCNKEQP